MPNKVAAQQRPHGEYPCVQCGSVRVHRSHRHGPTERVLVFLGAEIRRCQECSARQIRVAGGTFRLRARALTSGSNRTRLILISGFLICLFLVWWMITRFAELAG